MSEEQEKMNEEVKEVKAVTEKPSRTEKVAKVPKEVKSKRTKVTKMSIDQVLSALKICEESMGGYNSNHAKSLLARKSVLESFPLTQQYKKAA